ncbi:hypothetical protein WICPIJ_003807 [Wickerhamomyces pijperi]|uniref:Uncharacterized protein n=1 Tax=Wickerhamomyces pijperi TaxID=599730 RepID=A0A9P8Q6W6_WICPI|nr:hypothetical protein WICPIJ_003807 [Wickerhamomyces pijperi]
MSIGLRITELSIGSGKIRSEHLQDVVTGRGRLDQFKLLGFTQPLQYRINSDDFRRLEVQHVLQEHSGGLVVNALLGVRLGLCPPGVDQVWQDQPNKSDVDGQ